MHFILPNSSVDTSNVRGALFALPPPPRLDIHDSNAAEKWKEFERASLEELLNCHEVASGTRSSTSCNIPFCMSELKCGKFWLCLHIGQATPTKTRFSLCYKSLQRTVSHLKMCLLKDI